MQSAKDIIAGMDFDSMLKEVGADKPKQTRPNDAQWCNNAIQYRFPSGYVAGVVTQWGPWHFWNFDGHVSQGSCPKEWDFNDGRAEVERLRQEHGTATVQLRLVAILEVK